MSLKSLLDTWRHNIALHATLEIKRIDPINHNEREIVTLVGQASDIIKLQGANDEGIDVYINIEVEVLARPDLIRKYKFAVGKHAGLVLRAID